MKTPQPFRIQSLNVSTHPPHRLHLEHYGNPNGMPVLCVHGGPGGESNCEKVLKLGVFDPHLHHIVFFDQRGCGKSTPFVECEKNTPMHTVHDMERIRKHLRWSQLVLFGGSYGTSLIMLYTIRFPHRVIGYVMRSAYLMGEVISPQLQRAHPVLWKRLQRTTQKSSLTEVARTVSNRIRTHHKTREQCVRDWCALESSDLPAGPAQKHTQKQRTCLALMESYYEANRFFLPATFDLLNACKQMRGVKGLIVHGDNDRICPLEDARALHRAVGPKNARLVVVKGGGHSASSRQMRLTLQRVVPSFLMRLNV